MYCKSMRYIRVMYSFCLQVVSIVLGAGAFIAEIQQTSDVTYRIYDFNRKDDQGKTRELHTDLAREAINYEVLDDYRTKYEARTGRTGRTSSLSLLYHLYL